MADHVNSKHQKDIHADPKGVRAEQHAPIGTRRLRKMGEKDIQHAGFCIWATQPPDQRNMRAVARIVGRAEGSVRQWKKRYAWEDRADYNDVLHWSAYLLRYMYPRLVIPTLNTFKYTDKLREFLNKTIDDNDASAQVAAEDTRFEDKLRQAKVIDALPDNDPIKAIANALPDHERDLKQIELILRGMFGNFAKDLVANNVNIRPADIPGLVRTWHLINGGPTDIHQHTTNTQLRTQTESVRVQQVRHNNGSEEDVIDAIDRDLQELNTIVKQIKGSLASKPTPDENVIPIKKTL